MEKKNELTLRMVPLEQIDPFEHNANKHPQEQIEELAESIKSIGLVSPLVVCKDGDRYTVVAGHGRLEALKLLAAQEVPCLVNDNLSYKDATALAANLADNEIARHSKIDIEEIRWSLAELQRHEIDPIYSGYDEEHQKAIILDVKEASEDDFENVVGTGKVPRPKNAKAELGDIFEFGEDPATAHRLMCGSSTEAADVEKLLDGETVRLLLTDPPYNVNYRRKNKKGQIKEGTGIENDDFADEEAYKDFLTEAFGIAKTCMEEHSSFYIFYADKMTIPTYLAVREAGLHHRQTLVWAKNACTLGWNDYHWKHEPCVYGTNLAEEELDESDFECNVKISYGYESKTSRVWNNDRKQVSTLEVEKPRNSKLHPTMKPIKLLNYLIKNNTRPTDNVLDIFGGSGSTLMTCDQIDRRCFMMELDPCFVDVIIRRYGEMTKWQVPICLLKEVNGKTVRLDVREEYQVQE